MIKKITLKDNSTILGVELSDGNYYLQDGRIINPPSCAKTNRIRNVLPEVRQQLNIAAKVYQKKKCA